MAGPVKAFKFDQGDTAAIVGAARSRIRQVVIYAAAAGAFTLKKWFCLWRYSASAEFRHWQPCYEHS